MSAVSALCEECRFSGVICAVWKQVNAAFICKCENITQCATKQKTALSGLHHTGKHTHLIEKNRHYFVINQANYSYFMSNQT